MARADEPSAGQVDAKEAETLCCGADGADEGRLQV